MKKQLLLMTLLTFTACASKGPVTKQATVVPVPTYSERVGATSLSQYSGGACPTEGKWQSTEWRKLVGYASACVKANDWRKVESIGDQLAIQAHLTPWGPYFLSLAAASRKDYPRAAWMIELALKKAPNEGLFHYQMGRLHWEQGDDISALKELKLASDLNSDLTDAHYVMGQIAVQKEDFSGAEKLFQRALNNDKRHVASILGMASVKIKTRDYAAAANFLEDAIGINPRSAKARMALAQLYETQLKNPSRALSAYKDMRSQSIAKRLDESVSINLDEKIQTLQKSLAQVSKGKEVVRKPTAEGRVKQ